MDRFSASRFKKTHPIDLYLNGYGKNKDDDNMDNVGGKRGVPWPPKQHWTEVVKYIGTKFNLKWNEALKKWKELGKPNPTTEIKEPKKEKPKKEKPKKEEIKKEEKKKPKQTKEYKAWQKHEKEKMALDALNREGRIQDYKNDLIKAQKLVEEIGDEKSIKERDLLLNYYKTYARRFGEPTEKILQEIKDEIKKESQGKGKPIKDEYVEWGSIIIKIPFDWVEITGFNKDKMNFVLSKKILFEPKPDILQPKIKDDKNMPNGKVIEIPDEMVLIGKDKNDNEKITIRNVLTKTGAVSKAKEKGLAIHFMLYDGIDIKFALHEFKKYKKDKVVKISKKEQKKLKKEQEKKEKEKQKEIEKLKKEEDKILNEIEKAETYNEKSKVYDKIMNIWDRNTNLANFPKIHKWSIKFEEEKKEHENKKYFDSLKNNKEVEKYEKEIENEMKKKQKELYKLVENDQPPKQSEFEKILDLRAGLNGKRGKLYKDFPYEDKDTQKEYANKYFAITNIISEIVKYLQKYKGKTITKRKKQKEEEKEEKPKKKEKKEKKEEKEEEKEEKEMEEFDLYYREQKKGESDYNYYIDISKNLINEINKIKNKKKKKLTEEDNQRLDMLLDEQDSLDKELIKLFKKTSREMIEKEKEEDEEEDE